MPYLNLKETTMPIANKEFNPSGSKEVDDIKETTMSFTNKEFNPSGSKEVDDIKDAAEFLALAIQRHCPNGPLKDKAILDTQSASMFAVKSLFI